MKGREKNYQHTQNGRNILFFFPIASTDLQEVLSAEMQTTFDFNAMENIYLLTTTIQWRLVQNLHYERNIFCSECYNIKT